MEITAKMVSELREKTGAGMMKCKEALIACNGNMEEAIEYLRKKGLASADSKAGRTASQGLVLAKVSDDRKVGVLLEINCETDFVARNSEFINFANQLITEVLKNNQIKDLNSLLNHNINGSKVDEKRRELVAKIGENIQISRVLRIDTNQYELLDSYVHGDGKIGVIVKIECSNINAANPNSEIINLAHEISLQVAAMNPKYLDRNNVPKEVIIKEKEIIKAQLQEDPKNAGKPQNIIEKIVEGRLDKYFKEKCLLEQIYIKDDTQTVQKIIDECSKKHDAKILVKDFWRWVLGEATQS